MLIHGDLDSIVPSNYLLDAKDFLIREKVDVDTKIINNCEHNIPIEASSLALEFIKKNINK
jgi:phospholipase/carboxylesterase